MLHGSYYTFYVFLLFLWEVLWRFVGSPTLFLNFVYVVGIYCFMWNFASIGFFCVYLVTNFFVAYFFYVVLGWLFVHFI